ncbi:hypothetical protein NTH51_003385, partial [Vibrio fluvialis]|nr:hypothetical protein [Vibrio fluvialis]
MFLKWWFHLGKAEMKINLLVAAAITAILSGCGGGDEGGSTNESAGTVSKSDTSTSPAFTQEIPVKQKSAKPFLLTTSETVYTNPTKQLQMIPLVTEARQAIDASQQAIIEVAEYAAARNVDLLPQQVRQLRDVVKSDNSSEAVAAAVAHAKDVVNVQAAQVAKEEFTASQQTPIPYSVPTAQDNFVPTFVKAKQGKPAIPAAKAQGTPEIPDVIVQGTPSENITKSKQGKPQVTETRQAIDASQQSIIEVAEYAAARNVDLLPQQVRQLRDVVKSNNSPEAVAAAVAHAKGVVNVQAAQVAKEEFTASQQTPTPYAIPSAQDNSVPAFVKAKQGTPEIPDVIAQGIPNENITKSKQGKQAIPAANTQLTPNTIPAANAQGTPEIPAVIAQGTPSENITKSKQGKPQVTESRQAIDASQQAVIELAQYAAARDVDLLPQQVRQLRDVVKSDNSPEAVAAAVAHAKDVVNVQATQVAKEVFTASQQTPTPYAVPSAQDNSVPVFVKAKQGKPAIPAANTQLTPNTIPAANAQGTPEIPAVIAQGTPSENITKSKQGKPQVTETRQAIDASQQAIIELAQYAAARDVDLLPQQVHQLRDVVKSDNSPEAVAAAVARAKDVVNVQAAQVAIEEFTASQQTPTPYAVPTAQDNAVPLFVKAKQGKPAIPEAISQGIPSEEQVTPVAKGTAPAEEPVNVPTLVTTTETATVAPTKQLQMVTTPNEDRVAQAAKIDPMAELNQHMSDIGLVTNEGTYNSAAIAVRDIMNQDIRDGKDLQITLERAKLNADRVANQYGLTTPTKLDNNRTPGTPIVSGESRKERKLPSAKPSVVDVNVPVATVVSQNDPDVIQEKSFKKAKWEAQKEDSFLLNGYPQEGWVTSVGTLPSEMATLAPTLKTTNDVAPAQNIEFGETPVAISQGEPELITYEETFTGSIEVAPEDYRIPVEPEEQAPTYLTPEIVQQQAAKLDSVCLTNTQDFVKLSGGTLNTFGGSGNNFQEVKTDLTSDEDRFSYSMEIFAMLQQALADNPDLQQAIAQQHAGANKNSHVKATWTLSMDTGASYTLSTDSSQAYQPSIEVVVNNQGAVVVNDGNGIELARIVSNAQNGDC